MSAEDVRNHYATGRFRERMRAGVEELHVRATDATLELAELAELQRGETVIDVGSGLGGAGRVLARRFGVEVVGIDLTPELVEAAEQLTRDAGLADRVRFAVGDATALPFDRGAFDVAWTQHASMNIPDKVRLYGELRRVVRSGGRLAIYDVVAADGTPDYPLPWASRPELSALVSEDALDELLAAAGFRVTVRRDVTAPGLVWTRRDPSPPPPFENLARALADGRVRLLELVAAAV